MSECVHACVSVSVSECECACACVRVWVDACEYDYVRV